MPSKPHRPEKQRRERDIKQEPSASPLPRARNALRSGFVVCVTHVPSTLCTHEPTVRAVFEPYGTLLSVTIHHNFVHMELDGFLYLDYLNKEDAEAAIAAVKDHRVALPPTLNVELALDLSGVEAVMALDRGETEFPVEETIRDMLLGTHHGPAFSQDELADDEDRMLQTLSQHSFTSTSQSTRGKHKRTKHAPQVKKEQR
ncbi:hypothetical protein PsorP6_001684 [Peronosclerospora sorghi]|uniref:Uncharacterized protein n=1 Tax=Peronosclerospora sorghi TaxID=230839 RepID=A0ACC0WX42_9STRA|nr:hypothetical protein PsorP6_001684 [Peronosclerospora sorghi]